MNRSRAASLHLCVRPRLRLRVRMTPSWGAWGRRRTGGGADPGSTRSPCHMRFSVCLLPLTSWNHRRPAPSPHHAVAPPPPHLPISTTRPGLTAAHYLPCRHAALFTSAPPHSSPTAVPPQLPSWPLPHTCRRCTAWPGSSNHPGRARVQKEDERMKTGDDRSSLLARQERLGYECDTPLHPCTMSDDDETGGAHRCASLLLATPSPSTVLPPPLSLPCSTISR